MQTLAVERGTAQVKIGGVFMKYGESGFDIAYLLFAILSGCILLKKAKNKMEMQMGLATLIQVAVMTVLFFISYPIQREWVFAEKK